MGPFLANTDKRWFDYLSSRAVNGRVDEVNFWSPLAVRPMKAMDLADPVFFRLKTPWNAVAGYGLFANFHVRDIDEAWSLLGWRNGDPERHAFLTRISAYRGRSAGGAERAPSMACTLLRDARFWPPDRWIPWGEDQGWAPNIVQGKEEHDPARVALLMASIAEDSLHQAVEAELEDGFVPFPGDERLRRVAETALREGQGTFRARLLDAYGGACAVTGEHTEPVLAASHIQPYQGPRSNHIQNGLLLTQEFHTLFDRGLVGITPDYEIRVSPQIEGRWHNGRRYYTYDRRPLVLPQDAAKRPSREALEWHQRNLFVA